MSRYITNPNRWVIVTESYSGLLRKGVELLNKTVTDFYKDFLSVYTMDDLESGVLEKCNVILLGKNTATPIQKLIQDEKITPCTKAQGYSIGTSICEDDKIELAREMLKKAADKGVKFLLPIDNVIGKEYDENTEFSTVDSDSIPDGWMGLDVGPKTQKLFSDALVGAGTVVWNGPMGVSEWKNFAAGTEAVAKAVAESGAVSIIGGGDSAAAVEKLGYAAKMTHVSTGGGASLEFLEGLELPGIACLQNK